ncbi:hypothetical protein VE03_10280 [Pseudogymnoascus sp. 23342-1-I1]|nr:hypothetical protein VE03_10280 [Pseudogymnoascus sp. 23342-1-I1]
MFRTSSTPPSPTDFLKLFGAKGIEAFPSYPLQRKRSPATSNLGDDSRAGKRQKVYRPDEPLPSRERDSSDPEEENLSPEDTPINGIIPNSQGSEEKPLQASRPSVNQPSPVLGEGDDEEVVSESQGKETSGQSLQNATEPQEDIQIVAKNTPKPSNGAARRPSNKMRERSDEISDFEEHTSITPSITPSRGISDPYSDIETDLEQSTRRLPNGRVTPLRKSKKASPTKPKLVQYGGAATRSKAKSSSNNSTPKAIANSAPVITPRPARATNGDAILLGKTRQYDSASVDNGGIAELEQENAVSMSKAKIKAEAAARRKAAAAQKLKVKQLAAKEAS